MRISRHPITAIRANTGAALTIGNFDGVHTGHTSILRHLVQYAHTHDLSPTVLTFEPHPKTFFATRLKTSPARQIMTLRDKLSNLSQLGIEHTIVLPFNAHLADMSATAFVKDLLLDSLHMKHLQIGDDFKFGAKRAGDFALLEHMSSTHGFTLQSHASVAHHQQRISSSMIRDAIVSGDIQQACTLLGHTLTLSGHVIYGQQLGRTIGCPTANIKMPHHLAAQGIYIVHIELNGQLYQGVASIGTRPSVQSNGQCWLEVHILDFAQNIYGQLVRVHLLHKIRDEAKFDGLDALMDAIAQDIQTARDYFAKR